MNKPVYTIFAIIFTITIQIGSLGWARAASADALIDLTNTSRAQNGLADLTENSKLTSAAFAKANDMLSNDYFAHTSPSGKTPWDFIKAVGYNYTYAGENLAIGYTDDQELHKAWIDSPTHRANIVNGNFREIGIAVVSGEYDGAETTVVVQMFGAQKTDAPEVPITIENTPPTIQVQSAQTQTVSEAKPFTINREKTNFAPTQIFAGEKVKFTVTLTGTPKTIVVAIGDQKIDLMDAGTIQADGEMKIYTEEASLETIGNWPVKLTTTDENGLQQAIDMGNLNVTATIIAKETETGSAQSFRGILTQYQNVVVAIAVLVLLGLMGMLIVRLWPKKPLPKIFA